MFGFKTIIWGTLFSFAALCVGPWFAVQFDGSFPSISLGAFRYLGVVLLLIGAVLAFYCAYLLLTPSRGTGPIPYDSSENLVISGPYRFVRNPFMLGVVLALFGEAFLLSRVAMFAYAAIFTWSVHFWVVFFEEPALMESFGVEYKKYREQVPRWFPQFKKYKEQ